MDRSSASGSPRAKGEVVIEVVKPEREAPEGLFVLGLGVARPFPHSDDAVEPLFRHFLSYLEKPPTVVEVDLRTPDVYDVEIFGARDHRGLAWDEKDPLRKIRLNNDPSAVVQVLQAPDLEAAIREVVHDTGWYSCGAYGIVLDDEILVDKMYDGIYMEVVSRRPLLPPPADRPAGRE